MGEFHPVTVFQICIISVIIVNMLTNSLNHKQNATDPFLRQVWSLEESSKKQLCLEASVVAPPTSIWSIFNLRLHPWLLPELHCSCLKATAPRHFAPQPSPSELTPWLGCGCASSLCPLDTAWHWFSHPNLAYHRSVDLLLTWRVLISLCSWLKQLSSLDLLCLPCSGAAGWHPCWWGRCHSLCFACSPPGSPSSWNLEYHIWFARVIVTTSMGRLREREGNTHV